MLNFHIALGAVIRARRTSMGLSQKQLGDALNVSHFTCSRFERGVAKLSAQDLWLIAGVFHKTPDEIFAEVVRVQRANDVRAATDLKLNWFSGSVPVMWCCECGSEVKKIEEGYICTGCKAVA